MSERKQQIWLRPDQVELVVGCLQYVLACAGDQEYDKPIARFAKRNLQSRIREVLPLFGCPKKETT